MVPKEVVLFLCSKTSVLRGHTGFWRLIDRNPADFVWLAHTRCTFYCWYQIAQNLSIVFGNCQTDYTGNHFLLEHLKILAILLSSTKYGVV